MYETSSFFRDGTLLNFLVDVLEALQEFDIILDKSITRGIWSVNRFSTSFRWPTNERNTVLFVNSNGDEIEPEGIQMSPQANHSSFESKWEAFFTNTLWIIQIDEIFF